MEKYIFKRILNELDRYENNFTSNDQIKQHLIDNPNIKLSAQQIDKVVDYLLAYNYLTKNDDHYDLVANITLFARSLSNGLCEALALLESICVDLELQKFFVMNKNRSFELADFLKVLKNQDIWLDIILESKLFVQDNHQYSINPHLKPYVFSLFNEINQHGYLISSLTFAFFIKETICFDEIELRNVDSNIIQYDNYKKIMKILPKRGIPENRSISENLQSFYKDILVQEFKHRCPLCDIDIPNMLIASHIKPFRDCGHTIESTDNNNGILLCKNHDFLFDQGYISFDTEGKIMICKQINPRKYTSFNINSNLQLEKALLTKRRLQFLEYHRSTYYKN